MVWRNGSGMKERGSTLDMHPSEAVEQIHFLRVHPLPKVDETLAQPSGAKVFSN